MTDKEIKECLPFLDKYSKDEYIKEMECGENG